MDKDTRGGGSGLVRAYTLTETVWGDRHLNTMRDDADGWLNGLLLWGEYIPGRLDRAGHLTIDTTPMPELEFCTPYPPAVEAVVREAGRLARAEADAMWAFLADCFGPPPEDIKCPWASGVVFVVGVAEAARVR